MKIPSGTNMIFGLSMDNIPSGLNLYASGSGGATTLASILLLILELMILRLSFFTDGKVVMTIKQY